LPVLKKWLAALACCWLTAGCVSSASPSSAGADQSTGIGPVTLAMGTDGYGYLRGVLQRWNTDHPNERATILPLPPAADDQRAQLVNDLQVHSSRYDVMALDVVWTAEFADAGWITQLNPGDFPLSQLLGPAVNSGKYAGRLYAVPYNSNAGLLYYRTDLLAEAGVKPPRTWAELRADARAVLARHPRLGGYAGQFQAYEGLTVNFAEAVQTAGGGIVSDNATKVVVNSPEALTGLDFLVNGFREGWIPAAALGYQEEQSREAFEAGDLVFLRNWPYVYSSFTTPGPDNHILGKFGVVALPGEDAEHPGVSSLGGANLAISSYSRHQKSALDLIRFLTSESIQRDGVAQGAFPPVWSSLYDDPTLDRQYPYFPTLKMALQNAVPRPASPNYNQMSLIVSTAVHAALTGQTTPQAALASMATDLQGAIVSH
jgi:multiple sugar transport system substrate-binding protein